jgi:hypothetical protein
VFRLRFVCLYGDINTFERIQRLVALAAFSDFWGMFGNWEHQSRMEAVLCDGLTCFVLAPIFFLWSRKYGQLVDGWYFRGRGQ